MFKLFLKNTNTYYSQPQLLYGTGGITIIQKRTTAIDDTANKENHHFFARNFHNLVTSALCAAAAASKSLIRALALRSSVA